MNILQACKILYFKIVSCLGKYCQKSLGILFLPHPLDNFVVINGLCVSWGLALFNLLWCLAVTEKEKLVDELQRKTYVASNQRVSGVDAQRINSKLTELKTQLSQADKDLADLDCDLNAEEQLYRQEKMSVGFYLRFILLLFAVWSEVQTCIWPSWCHCYSLSLASVKSRLVLPFSYWLTRVVPDKGPLNGCMYVILLLSCCSRLVL